MLQSMAIQKISKEEIIHKSTEVFGLKGFYNTSMNDIATACGLYKGSLYHHFKSKEDLMRAVLEDVFLHIEKDILNLAYDTEITPKKRLKLILQKLTRLVTDKLRGCLFGNTVIETSLDIPELNLWLKKYFEALQSAFAHLFSTKYKKIEAEEYAIQSIIQIEGTLIFMKLNQDANILKRTTEQILNLLNQ